MKSKTTYRITLLEGRNTLADTLALLAASSNGNGNKYSLQDLKNVAEGQKILYPASNSDTTCQLIGNNTLHLDRKIGDDYQTTLIIEMVELFSLEDEIPTLPRHTSLLDDTNHELLN